MGPTYDMEVSASPSCIRDNTTGVPSPSKPQDKVVVSSSSSCLFLNDEDEDDRGGEGDLRKTRVKFGSSYGSDGSSESSSSIGVPEDSEDENDEVSSCKGEESQLNKFSMDLFGDSLPIKRGLSNHYSGKSKSFANLSEVNTVKDLEKEDNPFNKRRRVLIVSKWSRRSFYSRHNPKSMPLLPILPDDDDDDDDDEEEEEEEGVLSDDRDQHQAKR